MVGSRRPRLTAGPTTGQPFFFLSAGSEEVDVRGPTPFQRIRCGRRTSMSSANSAPEDGSSSMPEVRRPTFKIPVDRKSDRPWTVIDRHPRPTRASVQSAQHVPPSVKHSVALMVAGVESSALSLNRDGFVAHGAPACACSRGACYVAPRGGRLVHAVWRLRSRSEGLGDEVGGGRRRSSPVTPGRSGPAWCRAQVGVRAVASGFRGAPMRLGSSSSASLALREACVPHGTP